MKHTELELHWHHLHLAAALQMDLGTRRSTASRPHWHHRTAHEPVPPVPPTSLYCSSVYTACTGHDCVPPALHMTLYQPVLPPDQIISLVALDLRAAGGALVVGARQHALGAPRAHVGVPTRLQGHKRHHLHLFACAFAQPGICMMPKGTEAGMVMDSGTFNKTTNRQL